jgi:hypothetical protein
MHLDPFYPQTLREEELKNKVAADWFGPFDCTRIIGNVDFCVDIPATELALGYESEPALWAEAKAGNKKDIVASFVQLILTIGGEHTADRNLPPHFLGAFDAEKIAFIPYSAVLEVLGKNDFNWTVAPSDHESKEFKELYALVEGTIRREKMLFRFTEDEAELRRFIKSNFKSGRRDISKILINKNNFTHIYRQWRESVMPFINANWDILKRKYAIYDRDFYLAEMNIDDNGTSDIADDRVASEFYITFDAKSQSPYTVHRKNEDELDIGLSFGFKPGGLDAYSAFWQRYKRPPRKEYWDFIVGRLDLLVPQDVRERKGSFFTPQIWVEKSQQYLAAALGDNWQDDHYVWDCCAGTGNLLAGLTNKYNIWASTLDQPDVDVMRDRIRHGANMLESHVFQFDFLNDPFDKLPQGLRDIIDDPDKRKKLVIYINPPYAEAGDIRQRTGTGQNKTDVSVSHLIYDRYVDKIGLAGRELFALFLMRIHDEIPGCVIGQFSKLKHLQAPNFKAFRAAFCGSLERCFIVPADTFDNVKGRFPIGFFVWRLGDIFSREVRNDREAPKNLCELSDLCVRQKTNVVFNEATADVYDRNGEPCGKKTIVAYDDVENIGKWVNSYRHDDGLHLGFMSNGRNDFQNQKLVYFINDRKQLSTPRGWWITLPNLIPMCIFVAVRHSIDATWLNDRDQFLYPNEEWKTDAGFQSDCLVYSLFSDFNAIKSSEGVNHWIPFTEAEVGAKDCFKSHFMSDLLNGKGTQSPNPENPVNPVGKKSAVSAPLRLCVKENISPAASAVLDAGRELWRYYHEQPDANPNASYYDIRLHFQGATTDAHGKSKMNPTSEDATYNKLLANLRAVMKSLAANIEPKVYEYGFLLR